MSHQEPSVSIPPQQQKRSASADVPSATSRGSAVPPKKRARNQQQQHTEPHEQEEGEPDADLAEAGSAAPLDLSAPGRGKSRGPELLPDQQPTSADASSPNAAAVTAAASASAYMSRCAETLRAMGLSTPEDPADCWLAMGHWQASLHAQYLYYSSLALSGLLPPHPPPPPHPLASHSSLSAAISSKTPQPSGALLSPSFGGLFATPPMPPPPATVPPPPPLPPLMSQSQTHRSALEEAHSPAKRQPTPQSPSISHQSPINQYQQQHQQRKVKTTRAMPSAAAIAPASVTAAVISKTSSSSLPTPERQSSGETDLQCSCGRAFASLIGLTLHLKETGHGPCSNSRDRDIPKLVRGQDMWINSETEQTREILRCIRCKQSFRTLPELTMHMIKTRHYTEIIYTDTAPPSQQSGAPATSARMSGLPSTKEPGASAVGASKERLLQAAGQQQQQRSGRAEVKEADSATDPSQQNPPGATSTLQKMQYFVEASLPRSALRRPAMFQEVLQSSVFDSGDRGADSDNDEELQREDAACCRHKSTANGDLVNYLSPDRPPEPKENPLSSLQKLVDTAEKTSVAGTATLTVTAPASCVAAGTSAPPPAAPTVVAKISGTRDGSPTEGLAGTSSIPSASVSASAGAGGGNRHTVIMLSPTYIYQGGLYPPQFSVCHPSAALLAATGAAGTGPVDLSKLPPPPPPQSKQRPEEAASTPKKSMTGAAAAAATAAASSSTTVGESGEKPPGIGAWPESLMQKKAKCHFCSKPFANKGQVRLHVSKGKCPSLLARLPTAALPPFPFFPAIEYIKAAGRFHAAPPGSGKELQA